MPPTLEQLLELATRKLGSRKAVFVALNVSRQRFHSAMHGGPPLHVERLLRLALVAGMDPFETLRAGGRSTCADLLEQAARPVLGHTTMPQRALLYEYRQLSPHTQWLLRWIVSGLVLEYAREGELPNEDETPAAGLVGSHHDHPS